ncbi:MAG: tetratricopeptide repeat protein [Elusimicrobia bacterium]|nr:tetratricopeptide repeat protein [Elusimicrobiota bacterium]
MNFKNFVLNYPQDALAKDSRFKLAVAYFSLKNYGEAAVAFHDFIEKHPAQGRCYKKLKAPTEEKAAYEALRRLTPRDNKFRLAGLVMLGEMLELEGAKDQAVAIYQDIASYSPNAEWRQVAQEKIRIAPEQF